MLSSTTLPHTYPAKMPPIFLKHRKHLWDKRRLGRTRSCSQVSSIWNKSEAKDTDTLVLFLPLCLPFSRPNIYKLQPSMTSLSLNFNFRFHLLICVLRYTYRCYGEKKMNIFRHWACNFFWLSILYCHIAKHKRTQSYIHKYPFSPKLPFHPGCHRILSRVPCAIQQVFICYSF